MPIEITERHVDAPGSLKEYVHGECESLLEEFPRIEHIHVILDAQKHLRLAEVVVQAKNHIRVEAEEQADNLRLAVDAAMEKAGRQLRKQRDKVQDHKSDLSLADIERVQKQGEEAPDDSKD